MKIKLKYLFPAFIIGILLGVALSCIVLIVQSKAPQGNPELKGEIVLLGKYSNGTMREMGPRVPYDISGVYPGTSALRLSPDKQRVAYSVWENARVVIYISSVDGSNKRKIAQQEVPEGSGGLNVDSIQWSEDGSSLTYIEVGMICTKSRCENPNDFKEQRIVYSVDVNTGEKKSI